ncbi:MAG: threonine synthase [Deltaproteobacteria bacterium]|nr:threonine synthase [Deltaproteobacteria bacterium]
MKYQSTGGRSPEVDFPTALFRSLAPDGGLYLPTELPPLPPSFFTNLAGADLADTAATVAAQLISGIAPAPLRALLADALSFPIPLVPLGPVDSENTIHILELFHGPTLAFKDVGARVMARLFAHFRPATERPLTVLVATSGDTGSAVAQAFLGVEGTRVAVLYPRGKVSPVQECQFTTLGDNVQALAVEGTFDDCQRLVKSAFADQQLSEQFQLTSANSINLGRLLPQSFYYFHALAQLAPSRESVSSGESLPPVLFSVPSGNFGNLTAGLLARRLGLPCAGFVAATNVNDVVPAYLENGEFRPRPSQGTLSNAMDVGNPSNFARMEQLFGGELDRMQQVVSGSRWTDEETQQAIREVYESSGYILDPHTAVGVLGLRKALEEAPEPRTGVVLATAHPVKFRETVEPLIGRKIPLPQRLAACLDQPRRSLPLEPTPKALRDFLRNW